MGPAKRTWPRTRVAGEVKSGDPLKLADRRVGGSIPSLATIQLDEFPRVCPWLADYRSSGGAVLGGPSWVTLLGPVLAPGGRLAVWKPGGAGGSSEPYARVRSTNDGHRPHGSSSPRVLSRQFTL